MKRGTRVRMRDVGGQFITGTVRGPGPTTKIRPMNPAESEDIPTVVVDWDEPAYGSDPVVAAGLEVIEDAT